MKKPSNKKLKLAEWLRPLLTDLRWAAHNPNVIGAEPGAVMYTKSQGWEFGCKVEDHNVFMRRIIFVKAEQSFSSIPKGEKDPVLAIVFDEMLDTGVVPNSVEAIAPDCIRIEQDFIPMLLQKTETAKSHIKIQEGAWLDRRKVVH